MIATPRRCHRCDKIGHTADACPFFRMSAMITLMLHGEIHIYVGGQWWWDEIAMSPGFLRDITAANLVTVVFARLPIRFKTLLAQVTTLLVRISADSAKSCFKVSRMIRPTLTRQLSAGMVGAPLPNLPSVMFIPCQMHMFCIALMAELDVFKLLNSTYCSALLRLRGTCMSDTKALAKVLLRERLQDRYLFTAPPEQAVEYTQAILRLADTVVMRMPRKRVPLKGNGWTPPSK